MAWWARGSRIAAVEEGGMAAVADGFVERYLHPDHRAKRPKEAAAFKAKLLRADPKGYVATCHAVAGVDWLDRFAGVRTPTLVLAGARDVGATPEMAKLIVDRIAAAELRVFDRASHLSAAEGARDVRGSARGVPREARLRTRQRGPGSADLRRYLRQSRSSPPTAAGARQGAPADHLCCLSADGRRDQRFKGLRAQ